jgi:aminocarboxymuconate-semialdehyde decarboxylase
MAEIVRKYPERFPGFIGTAPMNNPDALVEESRRAIEELGAVGMQIYTNVSGKPLDLPEFEPFFEYMASAGKPVWLHPARGETSSDYQSEKRSEYEIWWTFGWPYETSAAMARMVFSRFFDKFPQLKIITHHAGGMVPFFEGRVGPGWDQMGKRTSDRDLAAVRKALKRPHLDYFKEFYADTAMFGGTYGLPCGLAFFGADKVVFATDAPLAPIPVHIKALEGLGLDPATRQKIMAGNAEHLLNMRIK